MKTKPEPCLILPKDARDKLMAAVHKGAPFTMRREIAINRAISEVKAQYPKFFTQEKYHETNA